ncbi:MAG: hypothetical protein ACQEQF_00335 [Bacillota bacterium]
MADKLNKDINGISQFNELHSNVGSTAFGLDHDTILEDTNLDVWTGPSKTGTQLTKGTDYILDTKITDLSSEAANDVYRYIKIINPTYETGDLYFFYYTVGDFVEAEDVNTVLPLDGSKSMTGSLDMGGNYIDDLGNLNSGIQNLNISTLGPDNTAKVTIYDNYNIQDILVAETGGDVSIPNGDLTANVLFDDTSFFDTAPDVATALNALSSAGVVDEGSTSDGDYIRYENGWQICVYNLGSDDLSALRNDSSAQGLTIYRYVNYEWDFPQSFDKAPYADLQFRLTSTNTLTSTILTTSSTNNAQFSIHSLEEQTDDTIDHAKLIAIGRWK